jgi:predicted NAD-dependent protein-ADP-ribosyltransferase YbiA (DUF1768 family)
MNEQQPKMRITDTHVYFVSGPFSQWHPSAFEARLPTLAGDPGRPTIIPSGTVVAVSHAEQAMMASKASVFGDRETLEKILQSTSPKS